tara:strand:+ start:262 stop:864 length:603 start_codon:yes stop_codon:yes gene_type:complete
MSSSHRPRSEETRRKIRQAAFTVFQRSGFERSTLAEISDTAGVHLQTLIRHFPTKGDLMADIHILTAKYFNKFLRERKMDALSTWRNWLEVSANETPDMLAFPSDSYRFPAVTPEGEAAICEIKEVLARAIAEDLGVNVDSDLRPILIASALIGGNAHVALGWAGKPMNKKKFIASLLEVVDVTRESLGKEFSARKVDVA